MAVGLATSPTARAMAIVIVLCPAIYAIWWNFWLVPALNALLYGGMAFGISKWRFKHRFSRQKSN
jgi:hypothetical protein